MRIFKEGVKTHRFILLLSCANKKKKDTIKIYRMNYNMIFKILKSNSEKIIPSKYIDDNCFKKKKKIENNQNYIIYDILALSNE